MTQENMELLRQNIRDYKLETSRGLLTEEEIVKLAYELDRFANTIIDCYLLEQKNKQN